MNRETEYTKSLQNNTFYTKCKNSEIVILYSGGRTWKQLHV